MRSRYKINGLCLAAVGVLLLVGRVSAEESKVTRVIDDTVLPSADVFGGYKLRLGVAKPTFTKIDYYSDHYGSTGVEPSFSVTRVWGGRMFALGWGLKFSYYSENGYATELTNPTVQDKSAPTSLTLVPYQINLVAQMAPFGGPWMFIDLWAGLEDLYYQEVRNVDSDAGTSTLPSATPTGSSQGVTASPGVPVNSGWNSQAVVGVALNFLLNRFGEQSVLSLRRTIGFDKVYISPFAQVAVNSPLSTTIFGQKTSKAEFSRTSFGVGFTFDSTY